MPSQTQKKQLKSQICRVYQAQVMNKSCKEVAKPQRLLAFVKDVLECGEHLDKVVWVNRDRSEFQFTNPHAFAGVYGRWIDNPELKFDNMCRSLREYKKKGIVEKVPGVESTWRIIEDRVKEVKQVKKSPVNPKPRKTTAEERDVAAGKFAELWKIAIAIQSR